MAAILGMVYVNLVLTAGDVDAQALQMGRAVAVMGCWLAIVWSRCLAVLLRWVLLAGTLTVAHGTLRVAASEAASLPPPGIPVAIALGLGRDPAFQDPRRLFREVSDVTFSYAEFAVLTCTDFLTFQWFSARSWLSQRFETGLRRRPPGQAHYVH